MRPFLKRGAELALVRSGVAGAWRKASGRDAVVLAYHNVVPEGDGPMGDSSLHLPLSSFKAQMDLFSSTHVIVPLQHLLQAGLGAPSGKKPLAAITFDDAYRGALELGVTELIRRGLPAMVFVSPGLLGCKGFWWDRVADPASGAVPPAFRDMAFRKLGGRQDLILELADAAGLLRDPLPDHYRPAAEKEVEAVARHSLITLGSHTWSHVDLTSVPGSEAQTELRRPLEWLEKWAPSASPMLSYPYGAFNVDLEGAVREAGYEAAFLVKGGPIRGGEARRNPLAIPRLNVPRGLSPEGFQVRISGAWPR